jgi:hypothetical protein
LWLPGHSLPDDVAPNFFTVNSKGEITATFSGVINAFGLVLPENEKVGKASEIQWVDDEGKVHSIVRSSGLAVSILELLSNTTLAGEQGRVILAAVANEAGKESGLIVRAAKGVREIAVNTDILEALILNHLGESSFLRLLTTQVLQVSFGISQVKYPGGSPETEILTVSHGLGRIPQIVLTSAQTFDIPRSTKYELINFKVQSRKMDGTSPVAGTPTNVNWIALG